MALSCKQKQSQPEAELKMVAQETALFDCSKAEEVLGMILQAHNDIDAVFCECEFPKLIEKWEKERKRK